jgi:hypothetical protein
MAIIFCVSLLKYIDMFLMMVTYESSQSFNRLSINQKNMMRYV